MFLIISNRCWILSNDFSPSDERSYGFSFLVMANFVDFSLLNQPYFPGVNSTWSWRGRWVEGESLQPSCAPLVEFEERG